jgi:hypothetical protein
MLLSGPISTSILALKGCWLEGVVVKAKNRVSNGWSHIIL